MMESGAVEGKKMEETKMVRLDKYTYTVGVAKGKILLSVIQNGVV